MEQLKNIENRLFQDLINRSVLSWLIFSSMGLLLIFYRSEITGWGYRENVQVMLWVGTLFLGAFRNKLSVEFKAGVMAFMLTSLAILGVLTLGLFAAALHFIPLIGILLLLFFQNKVVEKYYLIVFFLLSVAGFLFIAEWVEIPFDAADLLVSWQHWLLVLLCFTFYLYFSLSTLLLYKKEMASMLTQLSVKNEKLKQASYIDTLTGLPMLERGRHAFDALLPELDAKNENAAVMYLDLDEFKTINEVYGHDAGDWCIKEVSRRLEHIIEDNGLVLRIGSDEFLVVFTGFSLKTHALTLATDLLASIEEPINLEYIDLKLSTSIGIAFYPEDGQSLSELRRHADLAMYRAKMDKELSISTYKSPTP